MIQNGHIWTSRDGPLHDFMRIRRKDIVTIQIGNIITRGLRRPQIPDLTQSNVIGAIDDMHIGMPLDQCFNQTWRVVGCAIIDNDDLVKGDRLLYG